MLKDRLYFLTLAGITFTVVCISFFSIHQLADNNTAQLLNVQLEASRREAFHVSRILETQLSLGISKREVASGLQRSIENTEMGSGFICMYDTSGTEICHPDPTKVGQKITAGNSLLNNINKGLPKTFLDILNEGKKFGGVRKFPGERQSEVIYVFPVKNTDWMVAAHANIASIQEQLIQVRRNMILTTAVSSLLIILVSFTIVRWLGSKYEKGFESKKDNAIVENIAKLNSEVVEYRKKIEEQINSTISTNVKPVTPFVKKRLLTYWRDELISIAVEDIAFLYTQDGLTHVHCLSSKVYNSNMSLDEVFESLDQNMFFRANRQFIVSVRSIEKVFRYGNNQLKILTHPRSAEDIIISKNRASEFKEWLNM